MEITLYCLAVVAAAVITGLLGRFMVPFLHKLKFGQTIREVGPSWHKNKQGTPTMGGLMFIIGGLASAFVCIAFLWMHGGAETQLMLVRIIAGALMAVGFGLVGFMDDYISIKKHRNLGLTEIQKLVLQFIIAAAYLVSVSMAGGTTETVLPFIGTVDLGVFYYFIAAVLIVGMVNAVNFTDGLDGLNSSVTLVVCLTFSVIAMMLSMRGLSILAAAMVGALIASCSGTRTRPRSLWATPARCSSAASCARSRSASICRFCCCSSASSTLWRSFPLCCRSATSS